MDAKSTTMKFISIPQSFIVILFFVTSFCFNCETMSPQKKELAQFNQILQDAAKTDKMVEIEKYEELYPKSLIKDELLYQKGCFLIETEQFPVALDIFDRFLKQHRYSERYFDALYKKAYILDVLDQSDESRTILEGILRDINVLKRGLKKRQPQDRRKRKSIRQQLLKAEQPEYLIKLRTLYADILAAQKQYQDAMFQYRLLIQLIVDTPADTASYRYSIYNQQAVCLYALLEIDRAIMLLEENIDREKEILTDNHAVINSTKLLGTIYRRVGQQTDALRVYLHAMQLSLSSDDREYLVENTEELIKQEMDEKQLLAVFNKYKADYPGNIAIFTLLKLYDNDQRYEIALEFIDDAVNYLKNDDERNSIVTWKERLLIKVAVEPSRIGFIGPLSGTFSPLGLEVVRGARLSVNEFNEKINMASQKVELIEKDSGPGSESISEIMDTLVKEEKVIAIIGPVLSKSIEMAAYKADDFQIVTIAPASSEDGLPAMSPYLFRNSVTHAQQVKALVDYAMENRGLARFGIFYPQTSEGEILKNLFRDYVRKHGGYVFKIGSYPEATTDFTNALSLFKGATIEALFIPDYSSRVAEIAPQLAFNDITSLVLLGINLINSPDLVEIGGKYVENILFTDNFYPESSSIIEKDFIDRYQFNFGLKPTRYAAQSYDAAKIILSLLNEGVTTREALRTELLNLHQFTGVTGDIHFNTDGEAERSIHILTVEHGTIVQLK